MSRIISSIYQRGPAITPSPDVLEARNRDARAAIWFKLGLVVLDPADIGNEWIERAIRDHATKQYGPRGGRSERKA